MPGPLFQHDEFANDVQRGKSLYDTDREKYPFGKEVTL